MAYAWPVREKDLLGFSRFESPVHKARFESLNGMRELRYIFACDFIVPLGTPVFAMADGLVVSLRKSSNEGGSDLKPGMHVKDSRFWDLGNRIEVMHGKDIKEGEFLAYEHLAFDSSLVQIGDRVERGQQIAVTGYTGLIAHLGPHLHVERVRYLGGGDDDCETLSIDWENCGGLLKKLWTQKMWRRMEEGFV